MLILVGVAIYKASYNQNYPGCQHCSAEPEYLYSIDGPRYITRVCSVCGRTAYKEPKW